MNEWCVHKWHTPPCVLVTGKDRLNWIGPIQNKKSMFWLDSDQYLFDLLKPSLDVSIKTYACRPIKNLFCKTVAKSKEMLNFFCEAYLKLTLKPGEFFPTKNENTNSFVSYKWTSATWTVLWLWKLSTSNFSIAHVACKTFNQINVSYYTITLAYANRTDS